MLSKLALWSTPGWEVIQPAQTTPTNSGTVPSQEAEAEYISREFLSLTDQSDRIKSVPKTFPLSPNPSDGEKAEEKVFHSIKEAGAKIDNLRLIVFNGVRTTGVDDATKKKKLIREVDFVVYMEYQSKFYLSFLEVKCCKEEKGLNGHRKKATGQLNKGRRHNKTWERVGSQ